MADLIGDDQQLQLCFNRTHFQRSDFNVERFVNLARKRATLDQLQNDLRTYLRHLQNAMIELINDDYADFVNLSSSLAALRESVEKVTSDVQSNWSSFSSSISELEKCAETVEQSLTELAQTQRQQISESDKLALLQSLQSLHTFIMCRKTTPNAASWYSKLTVLISTVEFWSGRINLGSWPDVQVAKNDSYKRARDILVDVLVDALSQMADLSKESALSLPVLIIALQLIGGMDFALWRIVPEVINRRIGPELLKSERRLDFLLGKMLDGLLKLRESWKQQTKKVKQFTVEMCNFLDLCLLNSIVALLDERFSTVLVPTDARLFHRCYKQITQFIADWPSAKGQQQQALLRNLRDKFNLVVYFKLVSQPLLVPLRDQSVPSAFAPLRTHGADGQQSAGSPCLSPYSNSLLSTLDALYSPELFLPSLADKFWEFTLQRMDEYTQWAQGVIDHFACPAEPLSTEEEKSPPPFPVPTNSISSFSAQQLDANAFPKWLGLVTLSRDLHLFDAELFNLCLSTVWTHLRELRVDTTPFGQCLSRFSEHLGQKRSNIREMLIKELGTDLGRNLSAVSDIPRQYRWTKRPAPVGFSSYLVTAFDICAKFSEEARKFEWKEEEVREVLSQAMRSAIAEFCERAEKVLEAVEQTGSSMLRFKQRKAAAGQQQENQGETDETKIRAQLLFDSNLVRQRVVEYGVEDCSRLEQIEHRASNADGAETQQTG